MSLKITIYVILTFIGVQSVFPIQDVDFTCDTSNHVVLSSKSMKKLRLLLDTGNFCTPSTPNFKNCESNLKNTSSIKVVYSQEENDELVVANKENNYFQLSCVDQRQEIKATMANFSIASTPNPSYVPKTVAVQQSVSMSILQNNVAYSTPANIGDKLQLKITGPTNHSIGVLNCSATDGFLHHEVWSPCKYDSAIISEKWNITTKKDILTNDLFAFRFVNTTTVTIECYVSVCPSSDNSCTDDMNKPSCGNGNGKRRRRSSNGLEIKQRAYETHVASVRFDIQPELDSSNSSPDLSNVGMFKALLVSALAWFYFSRS